MSIAYSIYIVWIPTPDWPKTFRLKIQSSLQSGRIVKTKICAEPVNYTRLWHAETWPSNCSLDGDTFCWRFLYFFRPSVIANNIVMVSLWPLSDDVIRICQPPATLPYTIWYYHQHFIKSLTVVMLNVFSKLSNDRIQVQRC